MLWMVHPAFSRVLQPRHADKFYPALLYGAQTMTMTNDDSDWRWSKTPKILLYFFLSLAAGVIASRGCM
jgi:hypothetical protein